MAVAMVAMLAFGGTYAYFTAQADTLTSSNLKTGKVKLTTDNVVATTFTADVLPGDSLITADGITYVVDTTDAHNYVSVRVTLTSDATGFVAAIMGTSFTVGDDWTKVSLENGVGIFYQKVAKGGSAVISAENFVLPLTFGDGDTAIEGDENTGVLMEAPFTIKIEARSIQAAHIGEEGAYNEAQAIASLWA